MLRRHNRRRALPDAPPTGLSPGDDEPRHAQRDNNTYRRLRRNITSKFSKLKKVGSGK